MKLSSLVVIVAVSLAISCCGVDLSTPSKSIIENAIAKLRYAQDARTGLYLLWCLD